MFLPTSAQCLFTPSGLAWFRFTARNAGSLQAAVPYIAINRLRGAFALVRETPAQDPPPRKPTRFRDW